MKLGLALVWIGGFVIGWIAHGPIPEPKPEPRWTIGLCVDLIPEKPWQQYKLHTCVVRL